jgi:hydroxymethylbilane synthase
MTAPIRLGTRRSALALAQSQPVADALAAATGRPVELVEITTRGDVTAEPLARIGGTGVFVSALRDAVLAGEVDLAVHSYKDLPTAPATGLTVAAVPLREDPRDVLIAADGRKLADLRQGATVGTGSPRRAAQLLAFRPDLNVTPVRGNVDTRIRLVMSGDVDAVVLARAGLARLGRLDEATQVLEIDEMLPAPAQGALAVECRPDTELAASIAMLDDPHSRAAVDAERSLLATLEAGCSAPVGAYAEVVSPAQTTIPESSTPPSVATVESPRSGYGDQPPGRGPREIFERAKRAEISWGATTWAGPQIFLRATVGSADGVVRIRMSTTGAAGDPRGLGARLAARMLAGGAAALMGERHQ